MARDFRPYRDEMIISSKAGWDMWPGPYGDRGSRKYLIASCDQSLKRMGLDYVDIFYSHRFDPETPLEETMGALAQPAAGQGALRRHLVLSGKADGGGGQDPQGLGVPCLIHQPSYSILNRWIEERQDDRPAGTGHGLIAFSPLQQGMLSGATRRRPATAEPRRARPGGASITEKTVARVRRGAEAIAERAARPRAAGAGLGAAAVGDDLGADRRQPARAGARCGRALWAT